MRYFYDVTDRLVREEEVSYSTVKNADFHCLEVCESIIDKAAHSCMRAGATLALFFDRHNELLFVRDVTDCGAVGIEAMSDFLSAEQVALVTCRREHEELALNETEESIGAALQKSSCARFIDYIAVKGSRYFSRKVGA